MAAETPAVAAEFYPATANGSAPAESNEASSAGDTTSPATAMKPPEKLSPPENDTAPADGNGSARPTTDRSTPPPAHNNGNGSAANSGFNQLRNEFLTAARRVATTKKQAIGEVVEWASGGGFKYGDVGRMTEADAPKLRAATELIASGLGGAAH